MLRRATLARLSSVTVVATVFVAACGQTPAAPTTAPAATKPPVAATAPAAAPSPAAKPTVGASPATSPVAKPAASPSPAQSPAAASPVAGGGQLSGTIKIVSSLPRTGSSKGQTDTIVNAIQMALKETNNRVGGATIVYEDMDDATAAKGSWDAAKEAENANKAAADQDAMVYIGTFNSGAAAVSIPILCRSNLVMISPANTYPGLSKKIPGVEANEPDVYYPGGCKRNYTRVVPTDDIQGAVGVAWFKQLGATKLYILDDSETYGRGLALFVQTAAGTQGLQVVGGPESIDPKASDYRALAQKVRQSGADAVYYGGITQNNAGKLFQDLRSTLGGSVRLMGPDGIYEQAFIDAAGQAAENAYITFGGVPASKLTGKGAEWYQAYKQQFNAEPEAYASYGYEAAKVALAAIQRAGRKDRAAIRDAVFQTRDYQGVLGTWSFQPTGDTTLTTMTGRQVKNGKFDDANAVLLEVPR